MKQMTINAYSFDELSEQAKQKALEKFADVNVDYDWYQFTYQDAKNIGLKINGFDLDRGNSVHGHFNIDAYDVALSIVAEHGATSNTYERAQEYLTDRQDIMDKYHYNPETDESDNDMQMNSEIDDLSDDFEQVIKECYLSLLKREYEYLTSEQAIIEAIEANEYLFTEDGKLI
jgi:hypothetical protein